MEEALIKNRGETFALPFFSGWCDEANAGRFNENGGETGKERQKGVKPEKQTYAKGENRDRHRGRNGKESGAKKERYQNNRRHGGVQRQRSRRAGQARVEGTWMGTWPLALFVFPCFLSALLFLFL